jgi:hypothetical protein
LFLPIDILSPITILFDSNTYANKGAIKLINTWHAGVSAILTPESGFLAERKTDLDFLIIHSQEEAIQAIDRLKNEPKLYGSMIFKVMTEPKNTPYNKP